MYLFSLYILFNITHRLVCDRNKCVSLCKSFCASDIDVTWVGTCRARWNHAVMKYFVVHCIRPTRRSILVNGHWWIIGEVWVVQHLEHLVAANLVQTQRNNVFRNFTSVWNIYWFSSGSSVCAQEDVILVHNAPA